MKDIVKVALKIATNAHKDQFRNDGKTPYIAHPIAVVDALKKEIKGYKWYDKKMPSFLISAALLHDVLEDTKLRSQDLLKKGIPKFVVELVEVLTHKTEESYLDYIRKIRSKNNPLARKIKVEDIKHNLSCVEPWKKDKRDKYMLALYLLEH